MRIGVVTINFGYNYGNRLQCYAIHYLLTKEGTCVENLKKEKDLPLLSRIKLAIKKKMKIKLSEYEKRVNEFNSFNKKYLKIKNIYKKVEQNNYKTINNRYDCFICGSDQIWNPHFGFNTDIEYLSFVGKKRKIALAASFGVNEIEKNREHVAELLEKIDYISVREDKGKELVEELTNKQATVICDPTLVLSEEEWIKIERKPSFVDKPKFLLCYLLEEYDEEVMKYIEQIAKKNKLPIYYLEDEYKKLGKASGDEYSLGPDAFVWMIRNSEMIITDSFHAVSFSIIFKKQFKVIHRNNLINMNSRIDTILNKFNIRNAYVNYDSIDEKTIINYDDIRERIAREREIFLQFLRKGLYS